MPIQPITLPDLTTAQLAGTGVFDVLMRAHKEHLEQEFKLGRIKGPEYSTVYLGSLEAVLQGAITFLLQKDKTALEAALLEKQIELAEVEKQIKGVELQIALANLDKVPAEIALLNAQKDVAVQQALKTTAEIDLVIAQTEAVQLQNQKIPAEIALIEAQTKVAEAQALKVPEETNLVIAQTAVADGQAAKLPSEKELVDQQVLNAKQEIEVLIAQECKLRGEYDNLMENKLKTAEEKNLLMWKTTTEKAQTTATGVDDNSVIGKQKLLYGAQTSGYARDAEQKAAQIMAEAWKIQRTTDDLVDANSTNKFDDASVGQAISKLLAGINA